MTRFGRRLFAGGALGLAAISPWLRASRALAGGGAAPKRLVIWHTPAGTVETAFRAQAGATERDFTLPSILAPLDPFRDRLLLFGPSDVGDPTSRDYAWREPKGISIKTGNAMHTLATMLTGANAMDAESGHWASSVSIDQLVAQRIGDVTPFRSLELAAHDVYAGSGAHSRMSYAGAGLPMPPEQNPRATFDRIFAGVGGDLDPVVERARRRRRSVLDFGAGELARARAALGTEEQRYLDAHADSVRELERRLDALPGAACVVPTAPSADLRLTTQYNVRPPEFVHAQVDLMANALGCDLTRVASISFGRSDSHMLLPQVDGLAATLSHHELSHTDPRFAVPGVIADPEGRGHARLMAFAAVNQWYMEELARFMTRLDAMPEGDGTVLDHTLIVVVSEHSEGQFHTQENMPFFFAGGASDYFRMGRYVQFGDKTHNDMLLSIAHAMGLEDVTTFGDPAFCTGPLPGLT
jgi:hypothetical protein